MTTKFAALLLLTVPLAAQTEQVPYPLPLHLEVSVSNATLGLVCHSDQNDPNAFGIIVASLSGETLQFPGLPPLLIPQAILVCGSLAGDLAYDVPFTVMPFDLHLQAAGIVFGELAVSARRMIVAGDEPSEGK